MKAPATLKLGRRINVAGVTHVQPASSASMITIWGPESVSVILDIPETEMATEYVEVRGKKINYSKLKKNKILPPFREKGLEVFI